LHLGILYVRLALELLVAGPASAPPTLSTAGLLVEVVQGRALAASRARLGHALIVAHDAFSVVKIWVLTSDLSLDEVDQLNDILFAST
jgi:hypothetical protein